MPSATTARSAASLNRLYALPSVPHPPLRTPPISGGQAARAAGMAANQAGRSMVGSTAVGAGISAGIGIGVAIASGAPIGQAIASNAGAALGSTAGAYAGGALGSLAGPIGTAAGAIIGGAIGGVVGGIAGGALLGPTTGRPIPDPPLGPGGTPPGSGSRAIEYYVDYIARGSQNTLQGTIRANGPIGNIEALYRGQSGWFGEYLVRIKVNTTANGGYAVIGTLASTSQPSVSITSIRAVNGTPDPSPEPGRPASPYTPKPNQSPRPQPQPSPSPNPPFPYLPFVIGGGLAGGSPLLGKPTTTGGSPATGKPNTSPRPYPSANPKPSAPPGGNNNGPPTTTKTDNNCGCNKGLIDFLNQKLGASAGITEAAQTAQLAELRAAVARVEAKTTIIDGKADFIREWVKNTWNFLQVDRVLNVANTALNLHNAYYLSANIADSVTWTLDMILQATGLSPRDTDGNSISVGQVISQNVTSILNRIMGAENVASVKERLAKINRIYQAASNVLWAAQSIGDATRTIAEITGENVAKIGNALRRSGAVMENSFGWMSERLDRAYLSSSWFTRLESKLDNAENAISSVGTVASEVVSIQELTQEMSQARQQLRSELESVGKADPQTEAKNPVIDAEETADKQSSQAPESLDNANLGEPE